MKKLIFVGVVVLVVLTGCKTPLTEDKFNVVCLSGVEYWYRSTPYHAVLAPKFNVNGTLNACDIRG